MRIGEADSTAQKFHVEKVLVSGLDVHVRRLRDGTLNLEHLAPGADEPAATRTGERRPAPPAGRPAAKKPRRRPAPASPLDAFTLEKSGDPLPRRFGRSRRSRPTCATSRSPRGACRTRPARPPRSRSASRPVPGGDAAARKGPAPDAARGDAASCRSKGSSPAASLPTTTSSIAFDVARGHAAARRRATTSRAGRPRERRCASPTRSSARRSGAAAARRARRLLPRWPRSTCVARRSISARARSASREIVTATAAYARRATRRACSI